MANLTTKKFLQTLTVADVSLILIILVAIAIMTVREIKKKNTQNVYIYKNNELFGVYPLVKDAHIVIDEHNEVSIQDLKVRMIKSDCPDRRCVKQGSTDSFPIICLPNRVVVEIKKKENEKTKFILY